MQIEISYTINAQALNHFKSEPIKSKILFELSFISQN